MMKFLYSVLFIAASVFIYSCKTSRAITQVIAPKDTVAIAPPANSKDSLELIETGKGLIRAGVTQWQTFSAKIKLDIEDAKGKKPDVTANIRMIRDSAIWVSLTATFLGVEVFRVLIKKDSVVLLNKQEKIVQYRSVDYLQSVTDMPLDFASLQELIIGNPIFYNEASVSVKRIENYYLISSVTQRFKNLLTVRTSDLKLEHSKLDDTDPSRNRTADITYDDYKTDNGYTISTLRRVTVSEQTKLDVKMDFRQFEFNKELSLPFSIPKNYTRN